jgi:hypothetical protein
MLHRYNLEFNGDRGNTKLNVQIVSRINANVK